MRIFSLLLFVMLSHSAWATETGIASTFSDRHVACQPFHINPYKTFGVAHKTLPCGTMVTITNRLNGRTVSAPVVDKGPCTTDYCIKAMPKRIRKRILDLLPKVAHALGSNGLTPVSVKQQ